MKKLWFTADSHFGHKNIIKYCDRPYDSVEEMDRDLIENWNDLVDKEDEVYHLGDFSLDFKITKQVVPLLNGKKHLICGNHDLCHSSNHGASAYFQRYLEAGFASVQEESFLNISGQTVRLCHLPYFDTDDIDGRLPEHKPDNDGKWLLHGHVHLRWRQNDRQINVGVDVWDYSPVSLKQIEEIMRREGNNEYSGRHQRFHAGINPQLATY